MPNFDGTGPRRGLGRRQVRFSEPRYLRSCCVRGLNVPKVITERIEDFEEYAASLREELKDVQQYLDTMKAQ